MTPEPLATGGARLALGPPEAEAALVVFPGANCSAERYVWLGALSSPKLAVYVFAPPVENGRSFPTLTQALGVFDALRPRHARLLAAGHSAGAAAVLDALDPVSSRASPRDTISDDYIPPQDIAGVAVLGCSLQAHVLGMTLAYRSEDRPLTRPHNVPLLFVAGGHDLIAPPQLMEATRRRFRPPTDLTIVPGATHYGWASGEAASDNGAYDAPGAMAKDAQQARTLAILAPWLAACLGR